MSLSVSMSMSGYGLLVGVCVGAGAGADVDAGVEVGADVVNDGGAVVRGVQKHDAKFDADADVSQAMPRSLHGELDLPSLSSPLFLLFFLWLFLGHHRYNTTLIHHGN